MQPAGENMTFSAGYSYIDLGFSRRQDYETGLERMTQASVSSIGAVIPVGKKVSFIFDSMVSISERRNFKSSPGFYELDGNSVQNITTYDSGTEMSSFLMPGMRFQKNDSHAFQVALAGIVQFRSMGFNHWNSSKVRSFPVPMYSLVL
jgi:hypothetical protein